MSAAAAVRTERCSLCRYIVARADLCLIEAPGLPSPRWLCADAAGCCYRFLELEPPRPARGRRR